MGFPGDENSLTETLTETRSQRNTTRPASINTQRSVTATVYIRLCFQATRIGRVGARARLVSEKELSVGRAI